MGTPPKVFRGEFANFRELVDDYARYLRAFHIDCTSKVSAEEIAGFGWMLCMTGLEMLGANGRDLLKERLEARRLS